MDILRACSAGESQQIALRLVGSAESCFSWYDNEDFCRCARPQEFATPGAAR